MYNTLHKVLWREEIRGELWQRNTATTQKRLKTGKLEKKFFD